MRAIYCEAENDFEEIKTHNGLIYINALLKSLLESFRNMKVVDETVS